MDFTGKNIYLLIREYKDVIKKFFLVLFLFLQSTFSYATPFDHIVFFGDSLTDNGNLYQILLKILPKSPPYYMGRFTDGYTWAEEVGKYFYNQSYIDYKNYAQGGATAIFHIPTDKFIAPTNLELEINQYINDSLLQDKSKTLFVIWIGSNDYLFGEENNVDIATTQVVNKISWAINLLMSKGAHYFLINNVPDLSKTPYAQQTDPIKLHTLSVLHKQKLEEAIKKIISDHPESKIITLDVFSLFNDLLANPEKYNQTYHINIKNTVDPCWKGGFTLATKLRDKQSFYSELMTKLSLIAPKQGDTLTRLILANPILSQAYSNGLAYDLGERPCEQAEEYVFWDHVHPTEVMHHLLAIIAEQALENTFRE